MVWATSAVVQQLLTGIDKYGPRLQDPDFVRGESSRGFGFTQGGC